MNEPIEESYFNWLCAKVVSLETFPTYLDLMRILYSTEFVWIISGDRNRASDGEELRIEFSNETRIPRDDLWFEEPCSILEMLIAFSRRASFQTDIPSREWFWEFITNLNLEDYKRVNESDMTNINDILYNFIWRLYSHDGRGGILPIRKPMKDQTKVEIWYQFCEYVEDRGLLYEL